MKQISDRKTQQYIVWLCVGFLGLVLPGLLSFSRGTGLCTMIWIYVFLELTCRFRTKKQLCITGTVFLAGYLLKFAGAMGSVLVDVAVFGIFGIVLYGVFYISAYIMQR